MESQIQRTVFVLAETFFSHCLPRNELDFTERRATFSAHFRSTCSERFSPHPHPSAREEAIAANGIIQPASIKCRLIPIQNMDNRSQMNMQWMQTQPEGIGHSQQTSSSGPGDRSQARQRPDSKSTAVRSSIACIACRSKKQKVRTFLSKRLGVFPFKHSLCSQAFFRPFWAALG